MMTGVSDPGQDWPDPTKTPDTDPNLKKQLSSFL